MTTIRLLFRTLFYSWRTNLAVLLGVIAGTAVIGGALVVGDSVRYSLRRMTLDRLGDIDHALTGGRFFREDLADDLAKRPEFVERFAAIAPALSMIGSLETASGGRQPPVSERQRSEVRSQQEDSVHRAGNVGVYGLDERLWKLLEHEDIAPPTGDEVILNRRAAEELAASVGDAVTLWIEPPATIPRESLLGKRDEAAKEISLTVKAILPENLEAGRLALQPNQQMPRVAFVALDTLQDALDLAEVRPTRRDPRHLPARVNSLFIHKKGDATGPAAIAEADDLTELLHRSLTLDDLNLRIVPNESRGYLSLESGQMILETTLEQAGRAAAAELGWRQSPVLAYLANSLTNVNEPAAYSMYSIVAGLDFSTLEPPFGPFEWVDLSQEPNDEIPPPSPPLEQGGNKIVGQVSNLPSGESPGSREIVVNDWLAADLKVRPGDEVRVAYHVVGSHGELPEKVVTFRARGIVKLTGAAADRGLTPEVRGITNVESLNEWDQPFPMDLDKVTRRDEDYWDEYRATPKAFVSLNTAQELWNSRYGQLTSLRVAPSNPRFAATRQRSAPATEVTPPNPPLEQGGNQTETFAAAVLRHVDLSAMGLAIQPVKFQGLQAASGTTDFSGLFIGFSFFLILAAVILIGLLFRLGIERRGTNLGVLSAVGFSPRQVRRMTMLEGLIVVLIGGLVGIAAAVGYAALMVYGLKTWWIGAIGTKFLFLHPQPLSLLYGFVGSVVVAAIAVWWALREMRRLSTRELLSGVTEHAVSDVGQRQRARRWRRIGTVSFVIALLIVIGAMAGLVPATEAFFGFSWATIAFFVVGLLLLVVSLAFLSAWLDSDRSAAVRGSGIAALRRLGMRNASRHRQRSVLTVGMIASATFVIVTVAAGQRNPTEERPRSDSGNGGFTFVAESSVPILYDLNSPEGRAKLGIQPSEESSFDRLDIYQFRVKPGEDASCLNLYQTRLPTILGVPRRMIERGGFKFVGADRANPWTLLTDQPDDGSIPVLGDMNSLMYSLHKAVGDTIPVPNADNPDHILRIAGMLDGSIFQGVLLMSEANFLRLYPEQSGYRWFLIALNENERGRGGDKERGRKGDPRTSSTSSSPPLPLSPSPPLNSLAASLETTLEPYGFDVDRVADRLANFLAVQNTYLSTFMALGSLGLLLGTLGLATVMLRNVLERRAELALLRAVGFRNAGLAVLVLWENAFLLLWGLLAGTISALLAMLPHLTSIGADVPWASGGLLLGGVFLIGMAAALFAVRAAVRTPLVATLRAE